MKAQQMKAQQKKAHRFNVGKWLPQDYELIQNHIRGIKSYVKAHQTALTPNIQKLNEYVTGNPAISKLSNDMFTEVPAKYKNLDYGTELKSWSEFIPLLNGIMNMTMTYNNSGCVGFPINALLDWAMGTPSGHKFFLDNGVNEHFYAVINDWGQYLMSQGSQSAILNSNEEVTDYPGHFSDKQYYWLSDTAMLGLANSLNDGTTYTDPAKARATFIKTFKCDPSDNLHYGYKSWDDFFTRLFNPGIRPVASGANEIANSCESGPYRIAYNVQRSAPFWIKGQPYSLLNIFNETEGISPLTDKYEGGTIYQAFLSAESYHRWHSPVTGVVKTVLHTVNQRPFNSTYYSELLPEDQNNLDPSGPNESQGYISNVAARGIIEIAAQQPVVGDMCVIPIGMAECSTCQIVVSEGQSINKGDEIGMFHFGGSTHLLIFQKGVDLLFDFHDQIPGLNANNVPVRSRIATVVDKTLAYPTANGTSGITVGNTTTANKNSGAILLVVPSNTSAYPINVGNSSGQFMWGIDANGNVNTVTGTSQTPNPGAYCNLHINFPQAGSSGYVIGNNPNNNICAALKIVVPSSSCSNWPLVVANASGSTMWAIDCNGKTATNNPIPTATSSIFNMPYPPVDGGSNALMIGDVAQTMGCYGGISIIVPDGAQAAGILAIAVVDASGKLLWGVDASGNQVPK